jgi:hypothetical protein
MTARRTTPPANALAADAHWAKKLERLRNRTRPNAHITICDDQDIKRALADARREHQVAELQAKADPKDTEAQKRLKDAAAILAQAQAAFDDEAVVLHFHALERDDLQALISEHPPTEAQAEAGYDFNKDTLTPLLIAAASEEGLTAEDAELFLKSWGQGEADLLSNTVYGIQRDVRMDVGKG